MSPAAYPEPTPVLTAQRGGLAPIAAPTYSVTKNTRDLHIDHRILAQPGLSLTACVLLAEVLDLYRVRGQVFASNDHFAERCRCSERTVRSTITELQDGGYLERDVNQKRGADKRLLVPTDKWQNLPEAPAEFADINTTLNTKGNTTSNTPTVAAAAAAPGEKKIEAAQVENSSTALPAEAVVSAPPVAAAPPAKTRRRAERPAPVQAEPLPESCPLADLLNPPGDAHRVQQLAEPLTQAQAERLLHDYPEAMVRDILCQMANWQPLLTKATSANLTARNWLTKRANEAPRPARPAAAPAAAAPANPAGQVTKRLTVIEQTLADRQARRQQTP